MNNEGGFIYSYMILIVIIFSVSISFLTLIPIRDMKRIDGEILSILQESIDTRNVYERIRATLTQNMSYEGEKRMDTDLVLSRDIEIKTINEVRTETIKTGSEHVSFNIENQTEVRISIDFNEEEDKYYKISINHNNEKIDFPEIEGVFHSGNYFVIPKEFSYNKETNKFNYGEYSVELETNGSSSIKVSYDELVSRSIDIIEITKKNGYEKTLEAEILYNKYSKKKKITFLNTKEFKQKGGE